MAGRIGDKVSRRYRGISISASALCVVALLTELFLARPAAAATCIAPDHLQIDAISKRFSQERYLAGVDNPLKSEGELKLTRDRITWHMTVPFDVETIITPQGITQSIDGGPAEPTGDIAGLGPKIATLFANLLQGRWSELGSVFNVLKKPVAAGEPWAVSLQTIDPKLGEAISQIDIEGCTDISKIKISHKNGDYELIRFDMGNASTP
jgi:hypothetical protein